MWILPVLESDTGNKCLDYNWTLERLYLAIYSV